MLLYNCEYLFKLIEIRNKKKISTITTVEI